MSHVAVENVHGLEQQVRRTPALYLFFKKRLLHRRSSEMRYYEGGDKWLARRLARKHC